MHLVMKGLDPNSNQNLRDFVKRQVESKLSRVSKRIRSLQISIRDINGPRGGKDHLIQFLVRMRPTGKIVIRHRVHDPFDGIQKASLRDVTAVKRAVGRRRCNRINSLRRNVRNLSHSTKSD
jgi:putative sigma-54 modulation protein